jgi:hypothetical protein
MKKKCIQEIEREMAQQKLGRNMTNLLGLCSLKISVAISDTYCSQSRGGGT